jgi:hypothetical protein
MKARAMPPITSHLRQLERGDGSLSCQFDTASSWSFIEKPPFIIEHSRGKQALEWLYRDYTVRQDHVKPIGRRCEISHAIPISFQSL